MMLRMAGVMDKVPFPEVPHGEEGLIETLWLLLTSVIAVPLVCKLPGGSPVLGFLVTLRHVQANNIGMQKLGKQGAKTVPATIYIWQC